MVPPIRDHDMAIDEDDDDGMPPLVEHPNPSMTFTFFTDMTPITFAANQPTNLDLSQETPTVPPTSPPASPLFSGEPPATPPGISRSSHGKKRDASYIPRPPNAFILFRSSFIKSQQVPGKVEGNHSTLSKIIGMYWKTLPREEREQWEAKAVVAQAEHRKRYPDWRFRPGANAIAKLKVKDGTTKKRQTHGRKPKEEVEEQEKNKEQRCAKIADLLVKGKTGPALEAAVKEWEGHRMGTAAAPHMRTADHPDMERLNHVGKLSGGTYDRTGVGYITDSDEFSFSPTDRFLTDGTEDSSKTRSRTPDVLSDARFRVPLTSMFRRSLSAPASQSRCPFPEIMSTASGILTHIRRDTIDGAPQPQLQGLFGQQKRHEATMSRENHTCPGSTRCNDPFAHPFLTATTVPFASFSPTSTLDADATGPSSPTSIEEFYPVNLTGTNSQDDHPEPGPAIPYSAFKYQHQPYSSSYSTLRDWDREQSSFRTGGASSRAHRIPHLEPLAAAYTLTHTTSGLSTHIPTFDETFGWYGQEEESGSPASASSSVLVHSFPGRLDAPGSHNNNGTGTSTSTSGGTSGGSTGNKPSSGASTSASGTGQDEYAFFQTDVI